MSKYPADFCPASHAGMKNRVARRVEDSARPKTATDIKIALMKMDSTYSAVFYSWIKDENNLPCAISHFCAVANEYPLEQIILVLRWIIVDWKLKSIIVLVTSLTLNWTDEDHLGLLVKDLAETWKAPYVAELAGSVMERWDQQQSQRDANSIASGRKHKEKFLRALMRNWNFSRIANFFFYFGARVEWEIKSAIFRWYHNNEQFSSRDLSFAGTSLRQTFQTLSNIMPVSKTPTSPRFAPDAFALSLSHSAASPSSPLILAADVSDEHLQ